MRVAPIAYADLIKWFTNRSQGLPAYVVVDMVTQEATVVRLPEGMKYSFSEPLNRNIVRHLRFHYPTYMFDTPQFEIDEDGHPWWIAPRVVKTIGLFGGTDIQGAVLVDAITGESTYYEEVPTWVDNVYTPDLIMEQYDYHGTLVNGFINSILGQRGVTVTTDGYNYIALNDDVYVYTGITSANADQSNLGFLLSNQRTKETKFYEAPGATEYAAMGSAQGVVQDLGYQATFPLLLNIAGEPTYFIPLKDQANLVKSYAMVNVAQYQIVATGDTVSACEQEYIRLLSERGVTQEEELPQTQASGVMAEIRSAVLDGNTYYFIRLEGEEVFYSVSAAQNREVAVTLNVGDSVTIDHAVPAGGRRPRSSWTATPSPATPEAVLPFRRSPPPPPSRRPAQPHDTAGGQQCCPPAFCEVIPRDSLRLPPYRHPPLVLRVAPPPPARRRGAGAQSLPPRPAPPGPPLPRSRGRYRVLDERPRPAAPLAGRAGRDGLPLSVSVHPHPLPGDRTGPAGQAGHCGDLSGPGLPPGAGAGAVAVRPHSVHRRHRPRLARGPVPQAL